MFYNTTVNTMGSHLIPNPLYFTLLALHKPDDGRLTVETCCLKLV